jgi:peptidoglycan/LPS O-acetylase OafA/YrhL
MFGRRCIFSAVLFPNMPQDSPVEHHVPALDGLRGVAVLLVFIFHSVGPLIPTVAPIGYMGWLGVDLFFVLSGFLITSILLRARDAENYYKVFYARRALRILPLYYLALILSLLTTHDHYTFRAQILFWLNLSNLATAFNPMLIPWLSHYWSLAVEEQFYLIWPTVVKRLRPAALINLCIVVIVWLMAVRNIPAVEALSHHWDNLLYRLTPFRVDTLSGGALLAIVLYRRPNLAKLRIPLRIICLTSGALFLWIAHLHLLLQFGYTIVVLGFTSLVGLALYPGILSGVLSIKPLTVVGRYSYCIYLFHPILILHANHFLPKRLPGGRWHGPSVLILACLEFLIVFGVAAFSYRFIEGPTLSLKRYARYRRSPSETSLSPVSTSVPVSDAPALI